MTTYISMHDREKDPFVATAEHELMDRRMYVTLKIENGTDKLCVYTENPVLLRQMATLCNAAAEYLQEQYNQKMDAKANAMLPPGIAQILEDWTKTSTVSSGSTPKDVAMGERPAP